MRHRWTMAAAGLLALAGGPALAQKAGGTLRIYHWDSPPSASIHEETTVSTIVPFMGVFNNLILFDQHIAKTGMETIRPDLAESWSWDESRTNLTFKLHQGVKWHDGKPFTAKDVVCTWSMLSGEDESGQRRNPRKTWYANLDKVTAEGDYQATFHLKRPQPSFPLFLATGYSPVYPCHVPAADMRRKPIGTGPFKLAEFRQGQSIKLVKNPDYWKPGLPYLDAIEYRIIPNRSTRILAFVAGEFDMTFPTDITVALVKDVTSQSPQAICDVVPVNVNRNLIVNRDKPPFDNAEIRRAMALTLDRKTFIDILDEGKGDVGTAMLPAPEGIWAMPPDMMRSIPGYGEDVAKNRAEARQIMEKAGYGATNRLKMKVSTRNIPVYRDPAVLLIDQLKEIYIDAELDVVETGNWYAKVARKDYTVGLNLTAVGVDDPDVVFYENFACKSERNYTNYCNPEIEAQFDKQSVETDLDARRKLVWEIDRQLQVDGARPVIFHSRNATCLHPYVKNFTAMNNNSYSYYRFEDVWLDK